MFKTACCGSCQFAVETRVGDNIQKVLQCRLNPPTPVAIPLQDQTGRVGVQVQMLRPIMEPDDFCGGFEPRADGEA